MKGIILAGGTGSRLYPLTLGVSKQLMPIYDKPLIYYPLSTLIGAGIQEILIITTPEDEQNFRKALGNGEDFGCTFKYAVQEKPNGLAEAFIIGESFIGDDAVTLILGDNLFYGGQITKTLQLNHKPIGSTIFAYDVKDPERFGIVEIDSRGKGISIEEKPKNPKSPFAITGLYIFDNHVVEVAKKVKPSSRGEKEITSILQHYLEANSLNVELLDRANVWFDTGTHESLKGAADYVELIQKQHDIMICCPEELAYLQRFITKNQLKVLAKKYEKSSYGQYLTRLAHKNS
jgi:glucose-1-phosphate thymidylyltransferase